MCIISNLKCIDTVIFKRIFIYQLVTRCSNVMCGEYDALFMTFRTPFVSNFVIFYKKLLL